MRMFRKAKYRAEYFQFKMCRCSECDHLPFSERNWVGYEVSTKVVSSQFQIFLNWARALEAINER